MALSWKSTVSSAASGTNRGSVWGIALHTTIAARLRSFFYSFFATKEDLIVETLYLQQPRLIAYAEKLMANPALGRIDSFPIIRT